MPDESVRKVAHPSVWSALSRVMDPDFGMSIVDIGLVYRVDIEDDARVKIEFTLTSPTCPYAEELREEILRTVTDECAPAAVEVRLVWKPVWSPVMMSDEARFSLGFPI